MITRAAHRNLVYLHKSANTPRKKDVIHSKGSIQYTPKGVFSATLFLWIQVLHCFLLIFFNFFSNMYITVQVHYSLSRGKEKDWSLALPRGWLTKLVLFQKQPFDFLCLYYYNHYRKLKKSNWQRGCIYFIPLEHLIPYGLSKHERLWSQHSSGGHSIWMPGVLVELNRWNFAVNSFIL